MGKGRILSQEIASLSHLFLLSTNHLRKIPLKLFIAQLCSLNSAKNKKIVPNPPTEGEDFGHCPSEVL
jgi:hypothetical protein